VAEEKIRLQWIEYFYKFAELASTRSTCLRRQVGAVAIKENRLLASGYNGAPSKIPHCESRGCLRTRLNIPSGERLDVCWAAHAEQNVIVQAAIHGVCLKDSTLIITNQPCFTCAKLIINTKFNKVIFKESYPDELTINLFGAAMGTVFKENEFSVWEFNYF
jgi:dCMP deaminase